MKLAVSEIFGPTFQGEGPLAGRQAVFLRLSGCNLACTWCDTKYTWDWKNYDIREETKIMDVHEVIIEIEKHRGMADLLVITGGEPLLQWRALEELILAYEKDQDSSLRIQFETNGTIFPMWQYPYKMYMVSYVISPKLENSGNDPTKVEMNPKFGHGYYADCDYKFVIQSSWELSQIRAWAHDYSVSSKHIWVMPEGTTEGVLAQRTKQLAEEVLKSGWNLTNRMHVFLWGDKRGH